MAADRQTLAVLVLAAAALALGGWLRFALLPATPLHADEATGARLVVQEVFYPRGTSETLARLTGTKLVMLPGGAEFERGESASEHVKEVADLMIRALAE